MIVIFFHTYLVPGLIHDASSSLTPGPGVKMEELTWHRERVPRYTVFCHKACHEPGPWRDSPPSTKTAKKIFNCVLLPAFICLVLVPDKKAKFMEL